ncbi:2,3-epoxybenzoyl-CoA dihydrolase [Nonomuraea sp. NBC_01738]|uniref:2,3-epoxybenzoyl-CoA dihydrolase n=1 Tax=Nonomuraea sp. NBC_01738 TaxID=2976003 RepID=UPI002E13DFB0|nr:2,3-epoxybenzoyl-CoA dihydrolase [Nonomuraea sp. NBC_01738]
MDDVSFDTGPDRYRHLRLDFDGEVATIVLRVDEDGGLRPGYALKLNSYDLGVDIELHDAVQRLRFEHPEVRAVVLTGGLDRVFCAGANIRMLAGSSHEWKVNLCKFTNETRLAIEDATAHSGQTYLAAINGTAAGGGYELALACERIILVDDGSSAVSLPEVPLLAVLPGTGGLTRIVDKRGVRRDLADVFATRSEGVRGRTAVEWRLVDEVAPRGRFDETVRVRARGLVRPGRGGFEGIALTPLLREGYTYSTVRAELEEDRATITVTGPAEPPPARIDAGYWPLRMARELDDVILRLRTNEPELGTWVFRTEGDPARVLAYDEDPPEPREEEDGGRERWAVDEVRSLVRRTLKRLDVTSRSLIALIEPGSCFAGTLLELALACDRQYMFDEPGTSLQLSVANLGRHPMANGLSRLATRFHADPGHLAKLEPGRPIEAAEAAELGLITFALDDLDWDDEVRIALEERAALSPDALTGLEANLRFPGPETMETKIFARLAAWQNWIFTRPNAAGPEGALRLYGTGRRPVHDRKRA